MKRFLRFAALLSALALLGACDDDMYVTPLEVTNNNIAGTWQLAEWNGAPLAEGSFVYIEFIRKDAKYVMYQNLDSFGTRKLTGRFDRELASSVVELLRARGYLDDAALSARLAESFYDNKLWGPLRIRSELSARGFSPEDVAAALEPLEARDHTENIRTLAERKFGRLSFDDYAQKSKAFAYLYRCGYESADITDTISKMEQEEREWL